MTCRVQPIEGQPPRTLVFSQYEVTRVYADAVRGRDTGAFLKEIAAHRYDPRQLSDDYEDKLGVKVVYDDHGMHRGIATHPDEMTASGANTGPVLFGQFDQLWRERMTCPKKGRLMWTSA